jgi:hypothetical protein
MRLVPVSHHRKECRGLCNARPNGWSSPDLRDYGPVPDLPVVRLGDIPAPASEMDDIRAPND